jgi:hypothetical protein
MADILGGKVSLTQLLDWGASRKIPEKKVREFFGKGKEELTLRKLLALPISPSMKLWVVLRDQYMSERVMHRAALELAGELLDRLEEGGAYLDFRLRRLLAVKQRWLDGEISLGELYAAHAKAAAICEVVSELESTESSAAAHAAASATDDDGKNALLGVYNARCAVERSKAGMQRQLDAVVGYVGTS